MGRGLPLLAALLLGLVLAFSASLGLVVARIRAILIQFGWDEHPAAAGGLQAAEGWGGYSIGEVCWEPAAGARGPDESWWAPSCMAAPAQALSLGRRALTRTRLSIITSSRRPSLMRLAWLCCSFFSSRLRARAVLHGSSSCLMQTAAEFRPMLPCSNLLCGEQHD